jgi:hypothetical protein
LIRERGQHMDSTGHIKENISIQAYNGPAMVKKEENPTEDPAIQDAYTRDTAHGTPEHKGNKLVAMFEKYCLDMRVPSADKKPFTEEEIETLVNKLEPGDVLLISGDNYPHWKFLEKATLGSDFTHAAIYEGDGQFIEATCPEVIRTDLRKDLDRKLNFEVIRPPYASKDDVKAALDYSRAQLGKPYETELDFETDKELGCSELVQRALKAMPHPIEVDTRNVVGKKIVAPDAFRDIDGAQTIFSNRKSFLSMLLSKHYPVVACSAACAVLGSMATGPLGAIAGFIGGGLLSIAIGNKIETGTFGLYDKS